MSKEQKQSTGSNFRKFFFRGLAIVLPSVLTVGALIWSYNLIQHKIAQPINQGIRWTLIHSTSWPQVPEEMAILPQLLTHDQILQWQDTLQDSDARKAWEAANHSTLWLQQHKRMLVLDQWWKQYALGMDMIGLIVAIGLIYIAGAFLGSLIGKRIHKRGEDLIAKVPLIGQLYPSIKQVTDFLFGGGQQKDKAQFSRVVAVQYPRKGVWSVGLVTGGTMRTIEQTAQQACLTIFIPSSPTPFTGYVVTVPENEAVDLGITIEQALRFTISGGVIIPPSQEDPNKRPGQWGGVTSQEVTGSEDALENQMPSY